MRTHALAWSTESGGGSLWLEGLSWFAALKVARKTLGEECSIAIRA